MQIGIDSFVASISDPVTGVAISPVERIQNLLEEIELADQAGLDSFGVGEHHRPEFLDSAPHHPRCRRRPHQTHSPQQRRHCSQRR